VQLEQREARMVNETQEERIERLMSEIEAEKEALEVLNAQLRLTHTAQEMEIENLRMENRELEALRMENRELQLENHELREELRGIQELSSIHEEYSEVSTIENSQ